MTVTLLDATTQAELALRVFEESNDAFIVFSSDSGSIFEVNPTTQRLTGLRRRELLQRSVCDILVSTSAESVESLLTSSRETGMFRARDGFELRNQDGRNVPVSVSISRLHLEPEPLGLLVARNISDRKWAEQELRQKELGLQQAIRQATLSELIAMFVHELRQPLYAINNFAEASDLQLSSLNDEDSLEVPRSVRSFIQRISGEARRCNQIIDQIRQTLAPENTDFCPLDLNQLIHDACLLLAPEISQMAAEMEFGLEATLPRISGVSVQLLQVLINLLRNALQSLANVPLPERRVVVETRLNADEVEITVSDSGPGVAASIERKLFRAFSTTREGSLGLGLAISQRIVESHGGRIRLLSHSSTGARFRVTLPVAQAERARPPK